jgi:hypothetical protein
MLVCEAVKLRASLKGGSSDFEGRQNVSDCLQQFTRQRLHHRGRRRNKLIPETSGKKLTGMDRIDRIKGIDSFIHLLIDSMKQ